MLAPSLHIESTNSMIVLCTCWFCQIVCYGAGMTNTYHHELSYHIAFWMYFSSNYLVSVGGGRPSRERGSGDFRVMPFLC